MVDGLLAHSSHLLQSIDLTIFGHTKEFFCQLLSKRTATIRKVIVIVFHHTVCELQIKAHHLAIETNDYVAGFRESGL